MHFMGSKCWDPVIKASGWPAFIFFDGGTDLIMPLLYIYDSSSPGGALRYRMQHGGR